ncbi:MAG: CotH kinase family protein [Ferruginibacter sp.]
MAPLSSLSKNAITISLLPGFYEKQISLTLTGRSQDRLYYTLDGNTPSDTAGLYSTAINLNNVTAVSLRIKTDGKMSDTVFVGTYIVGFSTTLPVTTLILPPSDLFDPAEGIYWGHLTSSGDKIGNCWKDIEKPAFFEFFNEVRKQEVAQYCGLKIFGGMTRQNPEKSMRVIARKQEYGKGKFKAAFFKMKDIRSFNSVVLSVSGNEFNGTRFLDMMCSSIAKDLDIDYLAYQPSVLFVNGQYWGIHNIREKINEDYLESNHDVKQADLLTGIGNPKMGSGDGYKELLQFLETTDPNSPHYIDSVEKRMSIKNYFNYVIFQIHINNKDSRGNIRYWRSPEKDNKFRWIFYDADLSFKALPFSFLAKRLSPNETDWFNPSWATIILRKLTENKTLRQQFINQYCYLMSTHLSKDSIQNRIRSFKGWLLPETPRHLVRKDFRTSMRSWEGRINKLLNFAEERAVSAMQDLGNQFGLTSIYNLKIQADARRGADITIEENTIPTFPYSGLFFRGVPLSVSVSYVHPRYQFDGWSNGKKDRTLLFENPTDSVQSIRALLIESPLSLLKGKVEIGAVGLSQKKNAWIYVKQTSISTKDRVCWLKNPQNHIDEKIMLPGGHKEVVITSDTMTWRKKFPQFSGAFIQREIPFNQESVCLYLTDEKENIADSFVYSVAGLLPDSGYLIVGHTRPSYTIIGNTPEVFYEFVKSADDFWDDYTITLVIVGVGIILLIAGWLIVRSRRKNKDTIVDSPAEI